MLAAQAYDLVILDLGLPGIDGFEVLRRLRRRGAAAPGTGAHRARRAAGPRQRSRPRRRRLHDQAFRSARSSKRACARSYAADSRAALRCLRTASLVLDTAGRRATLEGEPLDLSARELGVLEVLMMRSGRVVNKEQLAEQLYGWDEEVGAERDRSVRASACAASSSPRA